MAKRIAVVSGTALVPGVSRNGRLYTREVIAKAVARAQARIDAGTLPLTDRRAEDLQPLSQRTHHAAEDDSTRIVGRITSMFVGEDGSAKFTADIANTAKGRDIAALADTSDGRPAFLRGVSIRGAWLDGPRNEQYEGRTVSTASDLELDGLDYTGTPGVPGALIDSCVPVTESVWAEFTTARGSIYEPVQEAVVTTEPEASPAEEGAPAPVSHDATLTPLAEAGGGDAKSMRGALAKGQAMRNPDGAASYPVRNKGELRKAIRAVGRGAADHDAIRRHIIKRARALGLTAMIPPNWNADGSLKENNVRFGEIREYMDGPDGSGFCIDVFNGPTCLTLRNSCISPADLRVVAAAAMNAAIDALQAIDPDMDADVDIPGAPGEDTDGDTGETAAPPAPLAEPANAPEPHSETAERAPQTPADSTAETTPPETEVAMGDTTAAENATTATPNALILTEDALAALGKVFTAALDERDARRKAAKETAAAKASVKAAKATSESAAPASETTPQATAETTKALDLDALKESIKAELRDEVREELLKRPDARTRKGLVGESDDKQPTRDELYADRADIMLGDFGKYQPATAA